MRTLVTGAAGFIGSHMAERLAADGDEVVGVDCFTDYYARAQKQLNAEDVRDAGVTLLELDLARDDLAAALEDVELVYHFAAQPGISASTPFAAYVDNNIVATHRLLEACTSLTTLRSFVNISTSSVYGLRATEAEDALPRPASVYGVTKLAAEQLVFAQREAVGLRACSCRLFSVYGPRERPDKLFPTLIRSIVTDAEFPLFQGAESHSRSFTFVGDIIDGLMRLRPNLDRCDGQVFNLGSETEFRTLEGIAIIEKVLGKKAKIRHVGVRSGDQEKTHANIAKAREYLGYSPITTLEDGLRQEVEWSLKRLETS